MLFYIIGHKLLVTWGLILIFCCQLNFQCKNNLQPSIPAYEYFPQQNICFWKSQIMTHSELKKRRSNVFFNILTIFSHSQMFPFTAQHEEVKRSRKTAVRKGEKKQRSTEACEAAILHLTLELPACAESVELRVSLSSSRSWGGEVMEQAHKAYASLRKVQDFYLKNLKRMEEAKINLTFNYFGEVIGSRCSRKHSGGKWVEIKTLSEHIFYSAVLVFCWAHSIQKLFMKYFTDGCAFYWKCKLLSQGSSHLD